MRRRVLVVCAVAVVTALVSPVWSAAEHPRNVILIGWDGAQREHVDQCLGRNELPNLKRLIDQGKYVKIDVEGTTDTKAGWSQILTGYYPEVTGVYSNGRYQPVPKGLSVFERLEKQFGTDDFVTVAVIGKKQHCGEIDPPKKVRLDEEQKQQAANGENQNQKKKAAKKKNQPGAAKKPAGKIVEENGVKYRVTPGSPYYEMHNALEVWDFGLTKDEKVGTRAIELLDKYKDKPFFFFVHFAQVDAAGHKNGENSKEYNDALISNDLWTGKVMDKVRELGLAEKTQIYVTADHGFDEDGKGHKFAPYVFLATNNKAVARDGRRQDVTPTILEAFGMDCAAVQPRLDGISLTKAESRAAAKLGPAKPAQAASEPPKRPDVVYVPTPQEVVDKMLELAQVKKDDLVYDLGCGDGRIVVAAAKRYGCKAFGFDVDPRRIKDSNENVQKSGVGDLVTIVQKDIFTLDLSDVDVVTLYLLPSLNVKLIPQLEKLKPGSRIVSHDFDMRGVTPDQEVEITSANGAEHTVYLWTTPLKKEFQTE